jgi:hypothetical protein
VYPTQYARVSHANNPLEQKYGILICINILFKRRICKVCSVKTGHFPSQENKRALPGCSQVVKLKILTLHCSAINATLENQAQAFNANEFLPQNNKIKIKL